MALKLRPFVLWHFFMFVAGASFAQTKPCTLVSGIVLSSNYQPIADVTIGVKGNCVDTIFLSNAQGNFAFRTCGCDSAVVTISAISFRTYVRKIGIPRDAYQIDLAAFVLESRHDSLQNVTITAKPIQIKGDTSRYSASFYKPVNPNATVADLLSNLPGVKVEENGTLSVKGKAVNTIKIDGKEYLPTDKAVLIKQLSAALIKQVEVVSPANSGFKRPKQVSLNLVTVEGLPPVILGKLQLEVGREQVLADVGVYSLKTSGYIAASVHHNNISESWAINENELGINSMSKDITRDEDDDDLLEANDGENKANWENEGQAGTVGTQPNGVFTPTIARTAFGRIWNDSNQISLAVKYQHVNQKIQNRSSKIFNPGFTPDFLNELGIQFQSTSANRTLIELNYLVTTKNLQINAGIHFSYQQSQGRYFDSSSISDNLAFKSMRMLLDTSTLHQTSGLYYVQTQFKPRLWSRAYWLTDTRLFHSDGVERSAFANSNQVMDLTNPNIITDNENTVAFRSPHRNLTLISQTTINRPSISSANGLWKMGLSYMLSTTGYSRNDEASQIYLNPNLLFNYAIRTEQISAHLGGYKMLTRKLKITGWLTPNIATISGTNNRMQPSLWQQYQMQSQQLLHKLSVEYGTQENNKIAGSYQRALSLPAALWLLPILDSVRVGTWQMGNSSLKPIPYSVVKIVGYRLQRNGLIVGGFAQTLWAKEWQMLQSVLVNNNGIPIVIGDNWVAMLAQPVIFSSYRRNTCALFITVPFNQTKHTIQVESSYFSERSLSPQRVAINNNIFSSTIEWKHRRTKKYDVMLSTSFSRLVSSQPMGTSKLSQLKLQWRAQVLLAKAWQAETTGFQLFNINNPALGSFFIPNVRFGYISPKTGWEIYARINDIFDVASAVQQQNENNVQISNVQTQQGRVILLGVSKLLGKK